ncbi:hypothetical protein C7460_105111 [Marinoscillum furvescens DSM 4134]|uniref:Co-chaperone DjlA N-terminal domain-containing protein n=2 Tax=Marinoscillum furvescens TaxID=1026 RepID=A0A3D9L687_MARFU|nr:hypothetical protein C7460_105111 [Marinoscillum furvescens DSM 4134]
MLLKSLVLHYHGLDEEEEKILEQAADDLDGHAELAWANKFISDDYMSAYDRAKEFFSKTIGKAPERVRLRLLREVWEDNNQKGYVTEMETMAMINLAKDWGIEKEFVSAIQT